MKATTHKHIAPGAVTVELAGEDMPTIYFELDADDVAQLDRLVELGAGVNRVDVIETIIKYGLMRNALRGGEEMEAHG